MRHATVADHPWIERHPGASQMQQSLGHERAGDVAIDTDRIALPTIAGSSALDGAFRDHHAWLVRRLTLVVGDPVEAEDLAQQVFLRVLEHRPDMEGRPIRPWLAAVGINLAISERRRRKRWGFLPLGEHQPQWVIANDPDLWRSLSKLKPEVRAALLLTVVDGYTQDEVAAAFGVQRGTVASWLFRARQQLRPTLMVVDDVS